MMMRRNEARICIALVVAASGCADVTAPLARTATAATTPPVLSETFVADGTKVMLRFTSLNAGVAGITVDGITIRLMSAPQ